MKRFHDPRQCLNVLRQHHFIEQYTFWNPINTEARWIVSSKYHKIEKGNLEEHRYSAEELKRWLKQLSDRYSTLRKALT